MNKLNRSITKFAMPRVLALGVAALAALFLATGSYAQSKTNAAGETFFIISSVDASSSQILVKQPSEVTMMVKVTSKTKYIDENGHAIKLSDLRAGNTVWMLLAKGRGQATASQVRMGPMTVAELHRDYLDYPEIK